MTHWDQTCHNCAKKPHNVSDFQVFAKELFDLVEEEVKKAQATVVSGTFFPQIKQFWLIM